MSRLLCLLGRHRYRYPNGVYGPQGPECERCGRKVRWMATCDMCGTPIMTDTEGNWVHIWASGPQGHIASPPPKRTR